MPKISKEELLERLKEPNGGLFKLNEIIEKDLKDDLEGLVTIKLKTPSRVIKTNTMKKKLNEYKQSGLTHLSISYGLDGDIVQLIMTGVKLDPNADLAIRPFLVSDKLFSTEDTIVSNHIQLRERFKEVIFSKEIVNGLYIRLTRFIAILDEFERESLTDLILGFGFMKAKKEGDWHCIHVVISGSEPISKATSKNTYSTADGKIVAPKIGCPPFGAYDDTVLNAQ